jgi:hypothetical protein
VASFESRRFHFHEDPDEDPGEDPDEDPDVS